MPLPPKKSLLGLWNIGDGGDLRGRIVSQGKLKGLVRRFRNEGKEIVFTNGCFDILHVGHVRYLQAAKALGDILIVGVNSDSSARRLKGPGRPIVPEDERAEIMASLECVDYVIIFSESTAERLVTIIKPDLYVKGGDYGEEGGKDLPEATVVASYGGRICLVPSVPDHSTTDIIERIRKLQGER